MKKKKINKELNSIKRANHSIIQFMEYLKSEYDFKNDELKQIENTREHLINMNVFFRNIENEIKINKA